MQSLFNFFKNYTNRLTTTLHTGVERARKQSGNKSSGLASTPARLPSLTTPTARPPQPSNASQQKVINYVINKL